MAGRSAGSEPLGLILRHHPYPGRMPPYLSIVLMLLFGPATGQTVTWLLDEAVDYQFNPGMPRHALAADQGHLLEMRSVGIDFIYGTTTYGTVALDLRDPSTGDLVRSCLLGDSVAVKAVEIGPDGVAYFTGRFLGAGMDLCDGSVVVGMDGGPFTENHFLLAWDLSNDGFLWVRNLSLTHGMVEDVPSIAVDPAGRLWYLLRHFTDALVVQVDEDGEDVISRSMDGLRHLGTLSFDPWGGLYVSGSCENGTLTFGGEEFPVMSNEGYNMFVLRFKPDGTAGFARFAEDITFQDPTVVATNDGHAYLAGSIFIGTNWGGLPVGGAIWGSNVFIARLDSTGTFEWILGPDLTPGQILGDVDRAKGPCIDVDDSGSVFFLGMCRGLVQWGSGVTSGTGATAERSLTLLAVNAAGDPQWSVNSEPATWAVTPQGLAVADDGASVHFMAHLADPLVMGGLTAGTLGQQSAVTGRIVMMPTDVDERDGTVRLVGWPIPATEALYVEWPGDAQVRADLIGSTGQVVRSLTLTPGVNVVRLGDLPAGAYLLRTTQGEVVRFVVECTH